MTTISQIVKKILIKEPFYGIFLLGLKREFGTMCDTACVYRNGINTALCINEDFWNNLSSDEEREAIILHELGHILHKHILYSDCFPDHTRYNYATDIEVNSSIPLLERDPFVYAQRFGFPRYLGSKKYYELLDNNSQYKAISGGQGASGSSGTTFDPNDSHNSWKDFGDLSNAERELIDQQIDYIAKNAATQVKKTCGNIPGEFADYINDLFKEKESVFNWKAYFRRVIGNSFIMYLKSTRYKQSVRFTDSPGVILKSKPKALVAVDTSGSISHGELSDFFTEIQHLYKTGVQVDVAEFDTHIRSIFQYKGPKEIKIEGRGGTDVTDVFKLYNEKKTYSTLVIFTDGYLSIENLRANNVIWVITSNGQEQKYPGKTVYIPQTKR